MKSLLAVWISLVCTISLGCSAASETPYSPLLNKLEEALISDPRNLVTLQSVFYPAKTASPSFVAILIDDCMFVVRKVNETYREDPPAFSNCSADCGVDPSHLCFTMDRPLYLSDGTVTRLLNFFYSENLVDILETVDFVSFELLDLLTQSRIRHQQPFDNELEEFAFLSLSIDELDMMPSVDDVWRDLELLLSWVSTNSMMDVYIIIKALCICEFAMLALFLVLQSSLCTLFLYHISYYHICY